MKKFLSSCMIMALMAFGSNAVANETKLTACVTGGGFYEKVMGSIAGNVKSATGLEVEILNDSTGSGDSIERFGQKECNITLVQGDAAYLYAGGISLDAITMQAHEESVYWIYNLKYGVESLDDMEHDDSMVLVAPAGSGAEITLKAFAKEDRGYEVLLKNLKLVDDYYEAANAVANGYISQGGKRYKVAGMVYPVRAGAISQEIIQDFGAQLGIGEVEDSDFMDAVDGFGDPLYTKCEIEKESTQGLKTSGWSSDKTTLCMRARVLMDLAGIPKAEAKKIKRAVIGATNKLK